MTARKPRCGGDGGFGCGHLGRYHRSADGSWHPCVTARCVCEGWQSALNAEDRAMLVELGVKMLPPDDPIYTGAAYVFIVDDPAEPAAPETDED
jgi:hypothetical protein